MGFYEKQLEKGKISKKQYDFLKKHFEPREKKAAPPETTGGFESVTGEIQEVTPKGEVKAVYIGKGGTPASFEGGTPASFEKPEVISRKEEKVSGEFTPAPKEQLEESKLPQPIKFVLESERGFYERADIATERARSNPTRFIPQAIVSEGVKGVVGFPRFVYSFSTRPYETGKEIVEGTIEGLRTDPIKTVAGFVGTSLFLGGIGRFAGKIRAPKVTTSFEIGGYQKGYLGLSQPEFTTFKKGTIVTSKIITKAGEKTYVSDVERFVTDSRKAVAVKKGEGVTVGVKGFESKGVAKVVTREAGEVIKEPTQKTILTQTFTRRTGAEEFKTIGRVREGSQFAAVGRKTGTEIETGGLGVGKREINYFRSRLFKKSGRYQEEFYTDVGSGKVTPPTRQVKPFSSEAVKTHGELIAKQIARDLTQTTRIGKASRGVIRGGLRTTSLTATQQTTKQISRQRHNLASIPRRTIIQRSKELQKQYPREIQTPVQIPTQKNIERQLTTQLRTPRQISRTRQRLMTKPELPIYPRTGIPSIPSSKIPPFSKQSENIVRRLAISFRSRRGRGGYAPSLTAVEFGITAPKKTKIATGFGIRPVVKRRKRKR